MGSGRLNPEVRRSAPSLPDSPERPAKRRRVDNPKSPVPTMEFWAVSYDSPTAQTRPVPIDPWLQSTLAAQDAETGIYGAPEQLHTHATLTEAYSGCGDTITPVQSIISPPSITGARIRSSRSPSVAHQYEPRTSPFVDCRGLFGAYPLMKFTLPAGGQVNGYLKLQEGARSSPEKSTKPIPRTRLSPDDDGTGSVKIVLHNGTNTDPTTDTGVLESRTSQVVADCVPSPGAFLEGVESYALTSSSSPASGGLSLFANSPASSSTLYNRTLTHVLGNPEPQLSQFFNSTVSMDDLGMRLWSFYTRNFIPGRTVMVKTNLWHDFAGLCEVPSVVSAIQSYMGLYIYDFTGNSKLANRINREFNATETRYSQLLARTVRDTKEDNELVTLSIILAMQDVVLPERRRKLPHRPRWIQSFLLAEEILDARDPGSRFWEREHIQLTRLEIAHTVMVGRALILAEPMAELKYATGTELTRLSKRFQWLLHGEVDEIHGGCGFSRKLLHTISQVTFLATCQASFPEGDWITAANDILGILRERKQINTEAPQPEVAVGRQPIEDIRTRHRGYIVKTREEMTEVSAEAWRITVIAYMQCRFWRLPRNHPDVISTVTDLAHCVRILPTSGYFFTAQAPLLPVFFLGLLGTSNAHREICHGWMVGVMDSPGRSSVPPLHQALLNIWTWISEDPKTTPPAPEDIPDSLGARHPWWEYLVTKIQGDEREILCVT